MQIETLIYIKGILYNFDRAVENVQRKIIKQKNTLSQRMQYTYPVLSRIGPWMRDKQRIAEVVKRSLTYYNTIF